MLASSSFPQTARLLVISACVVLVVAGMRAISDMLSAFFMAVLVAILCIPIQSRLRARGVSPGLSLVLVWVLIIGIGALLIAFIGISSNQVIRKLPDYEVRLQQLETSTWTELDRLGLSEQTITAIESFDLQSLIPFVSSVLRAILDSLGNILLVALILLYLLMDAPYLPKRLRLALGEDSQWLTRAKLFINGVQRYMLLRTVFGILIAAIQTAVMLLMGVDFAVQWGVLAVITNYIPNVGFIIGLIPPVAVTLLEKGPAMAIFLIVIYSVVNNVIENFVAPKFVGEELGISALFIFLSLIFWTWVLGAAGALLAVPLTLLIKIMVLDANPGVRVLAALISEGSGDTAK